MSIFALFTVILIGFYVDCIYPCAFCFRLCPPKSGNSGHRLVRYAVDPVAGSSGTSCDHRVGLGYDIHRFVPREAGGKPLTLGGVSFEASSVYVQGHSDGDAVLHALSDAVLGAVGLGDIGDHFPDTDAVNHDLASRHILAFALSEALKLGYRPCNVDVNIILQRPKLGAEVKRGIQSSISALVGAGVVVNVKAKTNEGLDAIGEGKALACQCVVLLERVA